MERLQQFLEPILHSQHKEKHQEEQVQVEQTNTDTVTEEGEERKMSDRNALPQQREPTAESVGQRDTEPSTGEKIKEGLGMKSQKSSREGETHHEHERERERESHMHDRSRLEGEVGGRDKSTGEKLKEKAGMGMGSGKGEKIEKGAIPSITEHRGASDTTGELSDTTVGKPENEIQRELGKEKGQIALSDISPSKAKEVESAREKLEKFDSNKKITGQREKSPEYHHIKDLTLTESEMKHEHENQPSASSWFSTSTGSSSGGVGYPICLRAIIERRPDLSDSEVEADIIFVQKQSGDPTQVIGSCRGIDPGLHSLAILEFGDASISRSTLGLHYNPSNTVHGGANTQKRHKGDLGNIVADNDGVAFFNFIVNDLPLVNLAGRALAVYAGEDDLGKSECECEGKCGKGRSGRKCGDSCKGARGNCFACISEINGNSGHVLGFGTLTHTSLEAMERLKNVKLGVGFGQTTHKEIVGRTMSERRAQMPTPVRVVDPMSLKGTSGPMGHGYHSERDREKEYYPSQREGGLYGRETEGWSRERESRRSPPFFEKVKEFFSGHPADVSERERGFHGGGGYGGYGKGKEYETIRYSEPSYRPSGSGSVPVSYESQYETRIRPRESGPETDYQRKQVGGGGGGWGGGEKEREERVSYVTSNVGGVGGREKGMGERESMRTHYGY